VRVLVFYPLLKCLMPADEILGGHYESGTQHAGSVKGAMGKVMNHKVGSQNTVVVATSTQPNMPTDKRVNAATQEV